MQGIVSALDVRHRERLARLSAQLSERFALAYPPAPYAPHVTYHFASDYDDNAVTTALGDIAATTAPFRITTTGLGVFTGPKPILYIPVVRATTLNALHERIWQQITPHARRIIPHSMPLHWTPHITLAHDGLTHTNLPDVVRFLSERPFRWTITLDHVTLATVDDDRGSTWQRFDFAATSAT